MTSALTESDRKVLKYEKRIGYVFAGLILSFGGFFNFFYFILNKNGYNFLMIVFIDLGIIGLAYFICNRINHKVNLDLKDNQKELIKRKVENKIEEKSCEAGSGALYIPVLGDLFPKLWGQKMRTTKRYSILTNNYKYEVDIETFNELKKGTDFLIHFAKHSRTILNVSKE